MIGSADDFRLGDWNVRCDRCGKKIKGSEAKSTWQGYWVCPDHWEPRHPQDFVRAEVEHPEVPFVRNPADIFLSSPEALILESSATTLLFQEDEYIYLETGPDYILSEGF